MESQTAIDPFPIVSPTAAAWNIQQTLIKNQEKTYSFR